MAAGEPHMSSARRARRHFAAVVGVGLAVVACGDGSSAEEAPLETRGSGTLSGDALPSCRDVDRAVAFGVFGAATAGRPGEADGWLDDPASQPVPRPGAAEVVNAYRDVGYEVVYLSSIPGEATIGDRPAVDAVTVWLGLNGFPVGEGVSVWAPGGDGSADPSIALIEELARRGTSGTQFDAAYAGEPATVFPLVAGGIPGDQVYLVGGTTGGESADTDVTAVPLSGEGLEAHATEVRGQPAICE